jgi:MFS transporter, DHA1 family, multidrug resistance protein
MAELIRDTAFGHLIRFLTGKRFLKFAEEKDPSIWTNYIDKKKSAYLADHGDTSPPDNVSLSGLEGVRTRENEYSLFPPSHMWQLKRLQDYNSRVTTERINKASGVKVDPEKGRDIDLVTWYGDDDPENVCCLVRSSVLWVCC